LAEAAPSDIADFPPDDVARLRDNLLNPEQFVVNFNYLARRANA
jgi:hypothetical protein